MKKITALTMTFLMTLLCGCTTIANDGSSYNNQSEIIVIESVISNIESDINSREEVGEITVERYEESYVTEQETVASSESAPGTQTVIIDSDLDSQDAATIKPADINTKGEKPLYFNHLTKSQKDIYRYMKTAAEEMKEGIFSIGAVKNGEDRFSDIAIAFRALSADNPQIFWLPDSYIISTDGSAIAFSYKDASYPMTPKEKRQAQMQLVSAVDNLTREANKLSSRFEKELFFHDWLCQNVTYKDDGTDNIYTAYGALVNGFAVCEGYSRAMQLLCDSVGIPCTIVHGSSRDVGHMWNIINPGDGWYHLDVTWDDDEKYGIARHNYFNVNDQQIFEDHRIFDEVVSGNYYIGTDEFNLYIYECDSEYYNYFTKKQLIFTDDYIADANIIVDAALKGKTELEVCYSGEGYNDFLTQVNIALWQIGSDIWIHDYSYLGDSLVLWW